MLGSDPSAKILVASYGEDLAEELASMFRRVVESDWYQKLFPRTRIDPRKNRASDIGTTMGGGRRAVSLGGALTGFGADLIVVDDLLKSEAALSETQRSRARVFFEETLHSRLNNKETGRIIVVQQRLHEDDFAGYLLEKSTFRHLNLPTRAEHRESFPLYEDCVWERKVGDLLCPERLSPQALEEIRLDIGDYAFSAQYQQNPVPRGSSLIRVDRMHFIEAPPPRDECAFVVQSWDLAYTAQRTSSFSVCTTWGFKDERWFLLDVHRVRLEFPDLIHRVRLLREQWRADRLLIERAGPGIALIGQLLQAGVRGITEIVPVRSKEDRAIAQLARLESGNFLIPTEPDWYRELRRELQVFPAGKFDDQVDSVVQFVNWAGSGKANRYLNRHPETGRPLSRRSRPQPRPQGRRVTWYERVGIAPRASGYDLL